MIPTTGLFSSRVSPEERNDEYLNQGLDFEPGKPFSLTLDPRGLFTENIFADLPSGGFWQFLEDDGFGNFETRQVLPAKTDQFSFTD